MAFESYGVRSSNFVGKDGFRWWVGQVEKTDENVKNSNRYKVRIIGHHLADCEGQGTDELPWANSVAPTTNAFTASGGATTNLSYGDWVIGFFMDAEMAQQPYILGSIGAIRNARSESDPAISQFLAENQEGCRAFRNFAPGPVAGTPQVVTPLSKAEVEAAAAGVVAQAGAPPGTATNPEKGYGQAPAIAYLNCPGSSMNEAAVKCTTISQASCPTGKTASKLEIVLSEMFKAISESGGQVGSYLTSKVTGYTREGEEFIMGYVNKILAIINQSYSWLKGKLYNLVKDGVQLLINSLLGLVTDKLKPADSKPPYDPKNPEKILDKIQKFLEDTLAKIGCSIEDLATRLQAFVEDFIFGALNDFWSEALCGIETLVNGLLSGIENFLRDAINAIVGPLLSILEGIAAPLNDVFSTISEIMDLLGISCSGLPAECKEVITDCGEGPKTKGRGLADDLDDLLAAISADTKPSPAIGACDDAKKPVTPILNVAITGGTFLPETIPVPTEQNVPTPPEEVTLEIVLDPVSATISQGEFHTFTCVGARSDAGAVTYNWQYYTISSNTWTDLNETANTFKTDTAGTYRCVVSGSATTNPPSINSQPASLTVNPIPSIPVPGTPPTSFGYVSDIEVAFAGKSSSVAVLNGGSDFVYNGGDGNNPAAPTISIGGTATSSFTSGVNTPVGSIGDKYTIVATPFLIKAGETVTLELTTENVPNGTVLDFYIFAPELALSDVLDNTLSYKFTVKDNKAKKLITFADELSFSTTIGVFAALKNGYAATQFAVEGNAPFPLPTPTPATPTPPIACQPVVSEDGEIIDIAICSAGSPYRQAPKIYIQGNGAGYGASAVADLDKDGFLKRIRVLRPGRGYPPNPPTGLDCIITGFTILKVGFGYDEPPAVFVDGQLDIAEAVIRDGVLVDIRVKDKSRTFTTYPKVKIIASSQGVGAIAIANVACLDKQDVREIAEVVGPTPEGEYIDCP